MSTATLDGLELEELFPVAQAKQQTSNNEINFHQDDEALIDHLLSPNSRHEPETAPDEQADCIASNPIKTNITGVDEISSSPAADAQSDTCQRISVPPSDETTLIAADPCTPQPKSQRSTVTRKAYTRKQYDRSNLRRSTRASVVKQTQKAHALAPKAAISDTAPIARSRKRGRPRRILKPTPSLAAPKPSSRFEVESIPILASRRIHTYTTISLNGRVFLCASPLGSGNARSWKMLLKQYMSTMISMGTKDTRASIESTHSSSAQTASNTHERPCPEHIYNLMAVRALFPIIGPLTPT